MRVKNNASKFEPVLQPLVKFFNKFPSLNRLSGKNILTFSVLGLVFIAFLWSYWPGLIELWELWRQSDEYSSGLLVPFLAVYVLWSRRDDIALCPIKPSIWGFFAFLGAQAVRLLGLFLMYSSAERLSIVLSIAALILFLFGWKFFRKIAPILLFLCLMLPLPNVVQYYVGLNLQRWATSSAVFCLEVIGYSVTQDGHTIDMGNVSVAVLEACNGLRMITAFFVISGLVVLLVERAWWEKLVILISSLPIALLCNTVRLAVTAIFFTILKGEYWEQIFHDFGGYAMMPLALAIVVGELWLLAKLTMLPTEEKAIIITRQGG
jgi:exosortase